jgi:hypothetical protein
MSSKAPRKNKFRKLWKTSGSILITGTFSGSVIGKKKKKRFLLPYMEK